MNVLIVAQYMVAAAFFTVALMHLMVWSRMRAGATHPCAALTAAAAGANAIAEQAMYRAAGLDTMAAALKWYVATSGIWIIALIWFVVAYTRVGQGGRRVAMGISGIFGGALIANFYSKSSFLYVELSGLREIVLPWGETIRLATGPNNPWRFVTEFALLGIFGLVVAGWFSLQRQGRRTHARLFTGAILTFLMFYATHAFLVDTGRVNSPYLSSYGFLLVVLLMSYDLSGGVARAAELTGRLHQTEGELQTAVADERNRIAGDLHDSVTQTLFSTAAIAEALPDVWDRHREEARRGLVELRQLTKGALAEMRSLLFELRPAALLEKRLGDLLRELGDAVAGRSKIQVKVAATLDRKLPDDVKVALYRVAQEALNNIIRHARARNATLCLQDSESLPEATGSIILSISDDGCGFELTNGQTDCLGLEIMRDRVETIGGILQIDSTMGQGTRVTVHWMEASMGDHRG